MKIKNYIEKNFQKALLDIIDIIKIKTVKEKATLDAPFGENLKQGLIKTLKIAENLGYRVKNLDNYIGYAEIGEGEDYIGVLGHIDVVPEGDITRWTSPPYEGEIKDFKLIGRGALDNKAPILSCLYSVKAILSEYPNFNKRVRIIFGTNEESGDEDINYYLKYEKPPKLAFTPDGRFPVIFSEKGIYTFSYKKNINWEKTIVEEIYGGEKSNIVPEEATVILRNISEEKIVETIKSIEKIIESSFKVQKLQNKIKIKSIGKSAHGSSPEKGINAVLGIYSLLNLILDEKDSLKKFVSFIDKHLKGKPDGEFLGIKTIDEETGNLTINTGITKKIGNDIYMKFNVRYPNKVDCKFLDEKLLKVAEDYEIKFCRENHNPPLYFPKDSILVKTLQEVYKKITKRDEEPVALGGGTYAKLMPNTVAFGPNFKEFNGNPHGYDEAIELSMLKLGMEIYAESILELSKFL